MTKPTDFPSSIGRYSAICQAPGFSWLSILVCSCDEQAIVVAIRNRSAEKCLIVKSFLKINILTQKKQNSPSAFLRLIGQAASERRKAVKTAIPEYDFRFSVTIITFIIKHSLHLCTSQTINLKKMSILSLLGFGERKKKVLKYLDQGALIIDIRMPEEFEEEHIDGSINMIQDDL